ncbi:uncharacterized protein BCR38DRAFT_153132 [Pseudomassariella vexata]|uniref:Uncharacterized protein n=1 Tax=Pseudomassariella vexata TaxID=1141098 RepID=A0A1Y2E7C4_9PEZI|nr:uncharacterized protein BCR38DRAFT_153132 [Pseudomassariella vexata]ORY67224.1 hypothetical protein BCR38DRAFT_153132 [Pseudomassariella vexata]
MSGCGIAVVVVNQTSTSALKCAPDAEHLGVLIAAHRRSKYAVKWTPIMPVAMEKLQTIPSILRDESRMASTTAHCQSQLVPLDLFTTRIAQLSTERSLSGPRRSTPLKIQTSTSKTEYQMTGLKCHLKDGKRHTTTFRRLHLHSIAGRLVQHSCQGWCKRNHD